MLAHNRAYDPLDVRNVTGTLPLPAQVVDKTLDG